MWNAPTVEEFLPRLGRLAESTRESAWSVRRHGRQVIAGQMHEIARVMDTAGHLLAKVRDERDSAHAMVKHQQDGWARASRDSFEARRDLAIAKNQILQLETELARYRRLAGPALQTETARAYHED